MLPELCAVCVKMQQTVCTDHVLTGLAFPDSDGFGGGSDSGGIRVEFLDPGIGFRQPSVLSSKSSNDQTALLLALRHPRLSGALALRHALRGPGCPGVPRHHLGGPLPDRLRNLGAPRGVHPPVFRRAHAPDVRRLRGAAALAGPPDIRHPLQQHNCQPSHLCVGPGNPSKTSQRTPLLMLLLLPRRCLSKKVESSDIFGQGSLFLVGAAPTSALLSSNKTCEPFDRSTLAASYDIPRFCLSCADTYDE